MDQNFPLQRLETYPAIRDLADRARKRIPFVAWEYLESGTGDEQAIARNVEAFHRITLAPRFMKGEFAQDLSLTLFGTDYAAPFGVAPVGLAGLMWPRAEHYLAQTAQRYRIPFCLSTVATETPETTGPFAGEMGWFQLYSPRDPKVRRALLDRAREAGFHTLVVTADVPVPSRRERTKRAGLKMPPSISPKFVLDALPHWHWVRGTLQNGLPRLRTVEPYAGTEDLGGVFRFIRDHLGGTLSWDYLKELRDEWKGPLILKGIMHPDDAEQAIACGVDGVGVSNHGARQFDATPAAIDVLPEIVERVRGRAAIIFDSGVRSGLDIVKAIHLGADLVLLGRAFIYGVAAFGERGADHTVEILIDEMKNNMAQLGCANLEEIRRLQATPPLCPPNDR